MQINYSGLTLLPSELTGEFTAASPELPKDRKSTRLNSSHSQISYAVFCLKKKKTEIQNLSTSVEPVNTRRMEGTHWRCRKRKTHPCRNSIFRSVALLTVYMINVAITRSLS